MSNVSKRQTQSPQIRLPTPIGSTWRYLSGEYINPSTDKGPLSKISQTLLLLLSTTTFSS